MVTPTLDIEKSLWRKDYHFVAGLDEVGRGAFAGPVVAGAVVFPRYHQLIDGLADSKLLRPKTREKLAISKHFNRKKQKAVKDGDKICASI